MGAWETIIIVCFQTNAMGRCHDLAIHPRYEIKSATSPMFEYALPKRGTSAKGVKSVGCATGKAAAETLSLKAERPSERGGVARLVQHALPIDDRHYLFFRDVRLGEGRSGRIPPPVGWSVSGSILLEVTYLPKVRCLR